MREEGGDENSNYEKVEAVLIEKFRGGGRGTECQWMELFLHVRQNKLQWNQSLCCNKQH